MPPNEKDKEKLVIDLLKKGYKTREITKLAHVSNTTVKKIRAKLTAEAKEEQEQDDQRKKPLSVASQAFNLFEEGKSVVHVTTGLDLTTDQALKIHSDYHDIKEHGKGFSCSDGTQKGLGRVFGFA